MGNSLSYSIRQEAIAALEKSNKMLKIAIELAKQGNKAEARKLRSEARTQRTISELLSAEANYLASYGLRPLNYANTGKR